MSTLKQAAISAIVPLTLLCLLGYSRVTYNAREQGLRLSRDSLRTTIIRERQLLDSALSAGDTLPVVELSSWTGQDSRLDRLPGLGYRYLYLYRDGCAACATIEPAMADVIAKFGDSLGVIAYHPDSSMSARRQRNHFGARHSPGMQQLVRYVPALIVLRGDGRVLAVGSGLPWLSKVSSLYNLIPPGQVEALVAARRTSLAGGGATSDNSTSR